MVEQAVQTLTDYASEESTRIFALGAYGPSPPQRSRLETRELAEKEWNRAYFQLFDSRCQKVIQYDVVYLTPVMKVMSL